MDYAQTTERLNDYRRRIDGLRKEMRQVQAAVEPQQVEDYRFRTPDGDVALSALFGDKTALFVIHNMGTGCPNCTMWADGFNGVLHHLEDRAAFVVCSPRRPCDPVGVRRLARLAVPHGLAPGLELRRRHGLSPRWRVEGGRVGVQARRRSDPAGLRHRLRRGRPVLPGLASVRPAPRGPRGWKVRFDYDKSLA